MIIVDLHQGRKMSAAVTIPGRPDRVKQATELLGQCNVSELADLIVKRLEGHFIRDLPGPVRDEEPRAIFVEIAKAGSNPQLAENLRRAVADLLRAMSSQELSRSQVIGDVCYLCTALGASDAINPLATLVSRDDTALAHLKDCEDLRLRALRSLVGLLGWHQPSDPDPQLEHLFERLLHDPKYELLSLTALVGLWPERRIEFIDLASSGRSLEHRLRTSLRWAGFVRGEKAHSIKGQSS